VFEEHKSYEKLIRPIEDQMLRSVWGITQNAEDAEEAFQEALSVIWRKWDRVQRHPNPHALVLRMCMNAAYDVLRKNVRRRRRESGAAEVPAFGGKTATPADTLESQERELAILRAIGQLSKNQALAVTLRLVQGHSYAHVAQILGCRDVTARKHVARGRERLRQLLAPLRN